MREHGSDIHHRDRVQESDGRWIAEVMEIPGVMVYGSTTNEAVAQAQALALRVLAERLEHGSKANPEFVSVSFQPCMSRWQWHNVRGGF